MASCLNPSVNEVSHFLDVMVSYVNAKIWDCFAINDAWYLCNSLGRWRVICLQLHTLSALGR
jgi:hypothetical protein